MPTYEYVCDACDHDFELFQQMSDGVKRKCPECGKLKLRRLIGTGSGVLFKGSGFYETDYRSDSYKKAKKADTSKKDGGSDGKSKSGDGAGSSSTTKKKDASPKSATPSKPAKPSKSD